MSAREAAPWRTVLYIFSCRLDLRLKSLSEPEEENCLALCVRRRKSLKRKAHSSLLLLVLYSRPLCSSLRGPRQLVSELKAKCWKRRRVRRGVCFSLVRLNGQQMDCTAAARRPTMWVWRLPRWAPHTGCVSVSTPACPSSPSLGPPR